jgi:integrase
VAAPHVAPSGHPKVVLLDGSDPGVGDDLRRRLATDTDVEATTHGFRSTFRDWAGDMTNFPREVCEQALAHVIADETEAAYRRSDALAKRRLLMNEWAYYCMSYR